MAIKTAPSEEIPYLVDYKPYQLPSGQLECLTIDDMVTVDVQSSIEPTTITYYVGSQSTYRLFVTLKNITNNATLTVSMPFPDSLFIVEPTTRKNVMKFELAPQESKTITIQLNKNNLNSLSEYNTFETNLPITIKNVINGSVATKNINAALVAPTYLPQSVIVE